MVRFVLCGLAALVISGGLVMAQDKKDKDQPQKATISKVDAAKNTITLKVKDKDGKDVEKTFDLKGDVKMFDKTGKVVAVDIFKVGGGVLVIEREGKLLELREPKE